MTTDLAILVLLAIGVLLLAVMAITMQGRRRETAAALDRLDTRLDEQGKRTDALSAALAAGSRTTEDVVRRLDHELREQHNAAQRSLTHQLTDARQQQQTAIQQLREGLIERFGALQQGLEQRQGESQQAMQQHFQDGVDRAQRQVAEHLMRASDEQSKRMQSLTQSTDKQLQEISGQVERRLSEGFEKTTETFHNVLTRLQLIDEAQKKITELSSSVVSLQEVLADRTSRGTFGEVQLHALVSNVLPEASYQMQYTLSNGKVVDCILFLPEPSGKVPIDSKFPLENYRRMLSAELGEEERKAAERNFARDVRTHVQDVASKYILPGETAQAALLFIPAEAVFAEIHSRYPDLVEEAHRAHVMMTSPTTLWAILTTAGAVLKDAATRKQVHIIQEHLTLLSRDFERFQERMAALARHIRQANEDADLVNTSARKISSRFGKIERLELENPEAARADAPLLPFESDEPEEEQADAAAAGS
ncbi:MAG: DNA recombination protein RmuC [Bryobacterales bacterium]